MTEWTRRGFLGTITAAFAGAGTAVTAGWDLDPEKALFVPGAKKIFIPKEVGLYQPKSIVTPAEFRHYYGPRYHVAESTGKGVRDYFFDDDWQLKYAKVDGLVVELTQARVREAEMAVGLGAHGMSANPLRAKMAFSDGHTEELSDNWFEHRPEGKLPKPEPVVATRPPKDETEAWMMRHGLAEPE